MFDFENAICCDWKTRLWKLDKIWTRIYYGFILFVGETFVLEGAARMSNKRKCAPSHFIFSLYDTQPSSDNFHLNNKTNFYWNNKDNFHWNDKDNLYLNDKDEFNSNDRDSIFSDVMAQRYHQTILISMISHNTNNFSRKPFT